MRVGEAEFRQVKDRKQSITSSSSSLKFEIEIRKFPKLRKRVHLIGMSTLKDRTNDLMARLNALSLDETPKRDRFGLNRPKINKSGAAFKKTASVGTCEPCSHPVEMIITTTCL